MKSALIKLHIAVFLWGFTGVLGRLISLNEMYLVWYRILITILSLLVLLQFNQSLQKISVQQKLKLLGYGVVIALHWVFFYGSIKYASVSVSLICLSTIAFFTALLEPAITNSKFNLLELLLSLISIAGVALIFHFDNRFRTGILLGLASAVFSALFAVLNKKNIIAIKHQTMMFYELLGGFIFLTICLPVYNSLFSTSFIFPDSKDFLWLLILAWICTIIAMSFSLQALQKVSAFTQNLTLNLEPVYGIALAVFIYEEQQFFTNSFYAGFSLIVLSVMLQTILIVRKKRVVIGE